MSSRVLLPSLQRAVTLALTALWVTGIVIVSLDVRTQGLAYLQNPKLHAKVAIVTLLTFNGIALHYTVLPALQKAGSLLKLTFERRLVAIFAGALSGVSWFYAALLGVGRLVPMPQFERREPPVALHADRNCCERRMA